MNSIFDRSYPGTVPEMCNDCPWRREEATPGWLGPYTPLDWIKLAHGEEPIACHQTIRVEKGEKVGNWDDPKIRQCRGMAAFRGNVCKNPKHPDILSEADERAFRTNEEFLAYHGAEGPLEPIDLYSPLSTEEPK